MKPFFQLQTLENKTAWMQQKHNKDLFFQIEFVQRKRQRIPPIKRFPSRHGSILVTEESHGGVPGENPLVWLRPHETKHNTVRPVELSGAIDDLYASLTLQGVQRSPSLFFPLGHPSSNQTVQKKA